MKRRRLLALAVAALLLAGGGAGVWWYRYPHRAAEHFAALYSDDPGDPCVAFHHRRLMEGETGALIEMHDK